MNQNITLAIQATLKGDWDNAISLNLAIVRENPNDIEALNRLAFAYTVLGKIKEAKRTYNKVLRLDKFNPIALKNVARLGETATRRNINKDFHLHNEMFLEEVGKTKVITLLNTAPSKTLRVLQVGQPVEIAIKRLKIFVLNENKLFLGMLPDNISRRLIKFMKGGNAYEAYIKSIHEKEVTIFVKEIKRAKKFKNQPSFILSDMPKHAFSFSGKKKAIHEDSEDVEESPQE